MLKKVRGYQQQRKCIFGIIIYFSDSREVSPFGRTKPPAVNDNAVKLSVIKTSQDNNVDMFF